MKKTELPLLVSGTGESLNDVQHLTGFKSVSRVVLLKLENGEQHLVVPQAEYSRALRNARSSFVWTPEMLNVSSRNRNDIRKWITAILAEKNVKRVHVMADFPHSYALPVIKCGVRLDIINHSIVSGRSTKKPNEIRRIGDTQQAAVIAMRSAISLIQRSKIDTDGTLKQGNHHLTAEFLRKFIAKILIDHGCDGACSIVACGQQTEDPHEQGSGVLKAFEPILLDIFPRHITHGFWGDITRTVVKGRPTPELRKMYNAVRAAFDAALSTIKAGIQAKTVHKAVIAEFKARGYEAEMKDGLLTGVISCTGHGIGLSLHEDPIVCSDPVKLTSGNVLAIEPGLCYPGIGAVRIEDLVEVTSDGCKYIAPCERKFEL